MRSVCRPAVAKTIAGAMTRRHSRCPARSQRRARGGAGTAGRRPLAGTHGGVAAGVPYDLVVAAGRRINGRRVRGCTRRRKRPRQQRRVVLQPTGRVGHVGGRRQHDLIDRQAVLARLNVQGLQTRGREHDRRTEHGGAVAIVLPTPQVEPAPAAVLENRRERLLCGFRALGGWLYIMAARLLPEKVWRRSFTSTLCRIGPNPPRCPGSRSSTVTTRST